MAEFGSGESEGFQRLPEDLTRWSELPSKIPQAAPTAVDVEMDRDREELLKSLFFPEMEDRVKNVDGATDGTCKWLFRHAKWREWAACDRSLLWIKGKPGSGKSTLLKHALEHGSTNIRDGPLILSFFFHGCGAELQKTPLGFFRALLYQLLYHVPDTLSDLVTKLQNWCKYKGEPNRDWQWSLHDLLNFVKSALSATLETRSVWLFVDALDECGKDNMTELFGRLNALLQESPSTNSQFRICFTCRDYPNLDLNCQFEICLDHENGQDISTYVKERLADRATSTIPIIITETITKSASGVFLWARLVIEHILDLERRGMGWDEIAAETNAIPNDLDGLYQNLVNSMDNRSASLKLIQWMCFAAQPLSLVELQWGMVIDAKSTCQSLQACQSDIVDDDTMSRQIQTLSCGLIELVPTFEQNLDDHCVESPEKYSRSKEVVQFIHQSVKDFFVEKGLRNLDSMSQSPESAIENAHYQLSRTCIRYLGTDEVGQSFPCSRNILMSKFPLLRYATLSWIWHETQRKERTTSQQDLLEYFGWPSESLVELWAKLYRIFSPKLLNFSVAGIRMVHVASHYQLTDTLQAIIQSLDSVPGNYIDLKDGADRTPLSYAAESGHRTVVQLLLDTGKVDVDSKDEFDQTPLLLAAESGRHDVVQVLLSTGKVNVNSKNAIREQWPLSVAAQNGHQAVVQLLLDTGQAIVDSRDYSGETPLIHAAKNGHRAVVQLLLNTGKVEADSKDYYEQTPLSHAAKGGHEAVVQLLIDTGKVEVDSRDYDGRTPLSYAAGGGHQPVVRLLLDTGEVDVNSEDRFGKTPLTYATDERYQDIVQLLLNVRKA